MTVVRLAASSAQVAGSGTTESVPRVSSNFLAGAYIDLLKTLHPPSAGDPEGLFAYRYMFLFSGVIAVLAFIFHYKVFRAWKRLGGDTSYEAPDSRMDITTLRPYPGDEGKSPKALIIIPGVMWLGSFLGILTWCAYYWWWDKNSFNVMIFGVAGAVSAGLFFAYTRFVRFMERP